MDEHGHCDYDRKADAAQGVRDLSKRDKTQCGGEQYTGVVIDGYLAGFSKAVRPRYAELPQRRADTCTAKGGDLRRVHRTSNGDNKRDASNARERREEHDYE